MALSYLAVISAAAAVVVAAALVMVLRICAAWRAGWRTYQSSTLPGPPLTHSLWGGCADLANLGGGVGRGRGRGRGWGRSTTCMLRLSHVLACISGRGREAIFTAVWHVSRTHRLMHGIKALKYKPVLLLLSCHQCALSVPICPPCSRDTAYTSELTGAYYGHNTLYAVHFCRPCS
jgi:hypothetical protein